VMFAVIFSLSVAGLGNLTTIASGVLSTAIAGGAVISLLFGVIKDYTTWEIAFLLPAFCYLYILYFGIRGYRFKKY
jgi:Fucose permease